MNGESEPGDAKPSNGPTVAWLTADKFQLQFDKILAQHNRWTA